MYSPFSSLSGVFAFPLAFFLTGASVAGAELLRFLGIWPLFIASWGRQRRRVIVLDNAHVLTVIAVWAIIFSRNVSDRYLKI